jgi:SAM-dependent methyltransferase
VLIFIIVLFRKPIVIMSILIRRYNLLGRDRLTVDPNIIRTTLMNKEKPLNATFPTRQLPPGTAMCRRWYATQAGQATLAAVQATVTRMTADVFGYYALETGVLAGKQNFLSESRIASHFSLGTVLGESVSAVGTPEHLPFDFTNLDLVVASHALDCTPQPHQVLREIERVLVPEGHCILIGFNPFSFRGLGQLRYWHRRKQMPCHTYSTFRVREWLNVLGFEVLETVSVGFCPAFGGEQLFQHTRWLDALGDKFKLRVGNVMIIHAQKKVSNMTPLLPSRKAVQVLRPGIVVNRGAGRVSRKEPNNVK